MLSGCNQTSILHPSDHASCKVFSGVQLLVAAIDIFFILLYLVSFFKRKGGTSSRNTNSSFVSSSIYLLLCNLAAAIWFPIRKWQQHRQVFIHFQFTAQTMAYLFFSVALVKNGEPKIPGMIRFWWLLSFLANLVPFSAAIFQLLSRGWNMPLELWLAMVTFPATVVLLVGVFRPRTGNQSDDDETLREPLLNGENGAKVGQADSQQQVTEYANAGIFSLTTMSWMNSLLKLGATRPLEIEDLPKLAPGDTAAVVHDSLNRKWQQAKEASSKASLTGSIIQTFSRLVAVNAVFVVINAVSSYVGPYLMDDFVQYLSGVRKFPHQGLVLALVFMTTKLVENVTQRQFFFGMQVIGLHLRSGLTAFVYQKGLRLSNPARQSHTSGDIVNYMAVDIGRITGFTWFMHDIWLLPLQIILALLILYKNIGVAAVATLVATVATIAVNIPITKMQEKYQDKIMEAKDVRMRATTECLRSMKILKLQAWEQAYLQKLEALRDTEWGWLRKSFYMQTLVIYIFWSTPVIVGVITFGTCVILKIPLTAGKVLSVLATIRILQEPLNNFPDFIATFAQTRVSLQRLTNFLHEEELPEDAVARVPVHDPDSLAVEVENGDFSWTGSPEKLELTNINLRVRQGMTVAVCGVVGSGKSSLLSCLLGEIPKISGQVKVKGTTAYVGQTAWIQSGKIEDNVLFGSPMDRHKYDQVLEACQLKKDLDILPYGDQTEIGERGINLSGGQKQRIQLARAVYQESDIYLLDDPFSAVDVQTGTQIFKETILGALADKTVILVTHQVEFLPVADLILVLKDGHIAQIGTYDELLKDADEFSTLVGAHHKAMESINQTSDDKSRIVEDILNDNDDKKLDKSKDDEVLNKQQLVQDEEREKGSSGLRIYWTYCTAVYKGILVPLIIASQLTFQLFQIAGNWWMARETPKTSTEKMSVSPTKLVLVYTALSFGGSLFTLLRILLLNIVGLRTSQKFFLDMLHCIFHAPMSFFDSTPTGRILNRASTDQSALDMDIPYRLGGFANSVISLLCVAGVISQALWQTLIVFIPVIILCILLQRYYISSARELSRITGIQKAPVIHHYSESIAGAPTIRGFGQEERFIQRNLLLADGYASPSFYSMGAMEWVSLRLELLSNIVFSFSLILLVWFPGAVDPSLAGLAVSYGLNLNILQSWLIWSLCNVENKIISVERIQQYTSIPSEAPWKIEEKTPPETWPSEGNVELVDLRIRYTENSPFVLHGITCTFPGGKKIGVVGRTGSGKSTLIQAIFRIIEPAGGKIVIDGVDITSIGLHDLRSKLSIIPQDPTLFEGTVRYNLDPLGQYSDSELWEALDKCQLGDLVRSKPEKLEAPVSENGENWSVGQRQLFCLGRVMLKRARVLVLDEATASVDSATDVVVQSTISKEFSGCTVITIAHRLPTVMDSDRVLVLSDGRVAEYDEPVKLLERSSSHFSKLVNEYSKRSFV